MDKPLSLGAGTDTVKTGWKLGKGEQVKKWVSECHTMQCCKKKKKIPVNLIRTQIFHWTLFLLNTNLRSLYSPWWVEWLLPELSAWPAPWVHPLVPSDLAWLGPAPCPCFVPGLRAVAEARWLQRHQAALAWLLTSGLVVGAGSSVLEPHLSGELDHSVVLIR